jgi:hypothetical protein
MPWPRFAKILSAAILDADPALAGARAELARAAQDGTLALGRTNFSAAVWDASNRNHPESPRKKDLRVPSLGAPPLAPISQLVVGVVPVNFLLEAARPRRSVNDQQFSADHGREIVQLFGADSSRQDRVMRPASSEPALR